MSELGDHEDRGTHDGSAATWHHAGAVGVGEDTGDAGRLLPRRCVVRVYCYNPSEHRHSRWVRCLDCYHKADVMYRDIEGYAADVPPSRLELIAGWLGRLWRHFWDGFREAGSVLKVRP